MDFEARRSRHRARKERVLHTRISEQLSEDLRRMADELRVPVSNLVRNVLEEAASVVETVSDNVGELVEDVVEEAERARERIRHRRHQQRGRRPHPEQAPRTAPPPEFPEVLGWQPLLLNQPRRCADCGGPIARGDQAYVGLAPAGLTQHVLCEGCMARRS